MPHLTKTQWSDHWQTTIQNELNMGLGSAGPGGSIVALENNSEIMAHGFGKASVANNIDFTVDTPNGIRSVTKVMTAAIALVTEQYSQAGWLSSPYNGGVVDREIGTFSVISSNIHREEYKFVDQATRAAAGTNGPHVVHTNPTMRHLSAHQGRLLEIPSVYVPKWTAGRDNRSILRNLMETMESIDDIVAQAGAVLKGIPAQDFYDVTNPSHPNFGGQIHYGSNYQTTYNDKAGWLTGAVLEQIHGQSLYELMETHFSSLGISTNAYPSYDGNSIGWAGYPAHFQGHHSHPIEIPGLAVAYSWHRGPNGELLLEAEQSTESAYAIGSAVMPCRSLAQWGYNLRFGNLLSASSNATMFSQQTNSPSDASPVSTDWPGVNWGFGPQKLESVVGASNDVVEVWGTIGQGGFGGFGGSVVWVDHNGTKLVVAANANTGIDVKDSYAAAKDYIESFL